VKSVATRRFWGRFHALPAHVQELAVKNYRLWQLDPHHPSLHFRKLEGADDRFSVRVGDHHRALGKQAGDTMIWVWIGTHAEYDRIVSSER
jgi:hypothetical protein